MRVQIPPRPLAAKGLTFRTGAKDCGRGTGPLPIIESDAPLTPDDYRERLPGSIALAHVTIEVSARPVRSR